jgi:L-Ala-D/L-Glu epimerase
MAGSENVVIEVEHDGIVGRGELAPGSEAAWTAAGESAVERWAQLFSGSEPTEVHRIEAVLRAANDPAPPPARAAFDMALWDWIGKRAGMSLWKLWGLDLSSIPVTSVTVGINPPDIVQTVTDEICRRLQPSSLKVKLGSPDGPDHDQAIIVAAQAAATAAGLKPAWRVDANGGWNPAIAATMIPWLASRGVDYVEQPYPVAADSELAALRKTSPLPIFADESIMTASDVVRLADSVDGINLKLMKTGGLTEALRLIHVARGHGLGVMIGCMGETSLAISAGAQLSPLVDYVDLDSHLNLRHDPFIGAQFVDGRVVPTSGPGLGVEHRPVEETQEAR